MGDEKMNQTFDELKKDAERLVALLSDPHPGLFTWAEAVAEAVEDIAEWSCNYVKPDDDADKLTILESSRLVDGAF